MQPEAQGITSAVNFLGVRGSSSLRDKKKDLDSGQLMGGLPPLWCLPSKGENICELPKKK